MSTNARQRRPKPTNVQKQERLRKQYAGYENRSGDDKEEENGNGYNTRLKHWVTTGNQIKCGKGGGGGGGGVYPKNKQKTENGVQKKRGGGSRKSRGIRGR